MLYLIIDLGKVFGFVSRYVVISGEEKQKILIARALLSEKELIIFDELNSAIDDKNNLNFYSLIDKYLKKKTVIIISHREKENKIIDNAIEL